MRYDSTYRPKRYIADQEYHSATYKLKYSFQKNIIL